MRDFLRETVIASGAYLAVSVITFDLLMPLQNLAFPEYPSRASLLFLPHGVRVLTAWLMGWRAVPALLPGVLLAFICVVGTDAFLPSRLAAIVISVSVAPLTFHALRALGIDLFPAKDRQPVWLGIMAVGAIASILAAALTNLLFGSSMTEFIAYLIGDMAGLFTVMLGLLLLFRNLGPLR